MVKKSCWTAFVEGAINGITLALAVISIFLLWKFQVIQHLAEIGIIVFVVVCVLSFFAHIHRKNLENTMK